MKEFMEKLIGRLEELYSSNDKMKKKAYEEQDWENFELFTHGNEGVKESIEIVNQLAEEYADVKDSLTTDGWIPVSKRLPDKLEPVNVTWVNRNPEPYYAHIKDIPFVATAFYYNGKWWWYSCVCEDYLSEYGESECDAVDKDIDIIAWQPLSQPYQPKGE